MRILVTGGAGYVGSHTAQWLSRQGHEPIVLDDLSTGHREFARFGPFEYGDVRDQGRVAEVLRRHRVQGVIHFAAKSVVEESRRLPEQYFSTNVGGLISLLAAMRQAQVQRLVFSSSCAVYRPQSQPLQEDAALGPLSIYGVTKQHGEEVLARVAPALGLRYAVLRYFNVVGADAQGQLWEWHAPETHVVPCLLRAAARGEPFRLFGTDYPTPDGSAVRDYVDVRDVAQVHLEALEHLEGAPRLISNLGTGQGVSVRQLVSLAEDVQGRPVAVQEQPAREGDAPSLVADNRHLLTWSATARRGLRGLRQSLLDLRNAPSARLS